MNLLATTLHLANKPDGGVLICLVVALVLFAVAAVVSVMERSWFSAIAFGGLFFFALSFLVT